MLEKYLGKIRTNKAHHILFPVHFRFRLTPTAHPGAVTSLIFAILTIVGLGTIASTGTVAGIGTTTGLGTIAGLGTVAGLGAVARETLGTVASLGFDTVAGPGDVTGHLACKKRSIC